MSQQDRKDNSVDGLLDLIQSSPPESTGVRIVGIDGGGGAGKSTLARRLFEAAEDAECVHIDDFYRPSPKDPELREELCWFFDWRRLRDEVLMPVARGGRASFRPYDWDAEKLSDDEIVIEGRGILVVEGISVLREELRPWIDVGIWVETPADVRLERGVERDGEEARDRWVNFWMVEEVRYFESHRPREYAQVVVRGDSREG